MKYYKYWQGEDGIRNVIPNRKLASGEKNFYPEGTHILDALSVMIQPPNKNYPPVTPLVEVGCGYGRLCPAFDPKDYAGVDINEKAIDMARKANPGYLFEHITQYKYPASFSKLLYTVLMHIPDEEYPQCISALCNSTLNQIVIVEILGRRRRRQLEKKEIGWIQPTFGRELKEHVEALKTHKWYLKDKQEWPYPSKSACITALDFRRFNVYDVNKD